MEHLDRLDANDNKFEVVEVIFMEDKESCYDYLLHFA